MHQRRTVLLCNRLQVIAALLPIATGTCVSVGLSLLIVAAAGPLPVLVFLVRVDGLSHNDQACGATEGTCQDSDARRSQGHGEETPGNPRHLLAPHAQPELRPARIPPVRR